MYRFASGTTHQTIYFPEAKAFYVCIPAVKEQRAIAGVLGALDDKIELNWRMNGTLEAMTRALFKSWFVDFDLVRAKAEGRDPGLPKHISSLFVDVFEDSELGQIPRGWRVRQLGDASAYLSRGISPAYTEHDGVLVLNQKCVRDGRLDVSKGRRHDAKVRSVQSRLLKRGDLLVNSTGVGTLGRVAQVLSLEEDTIVDSHLTIVRADERLMSWNYLGVSLGRREEEIEALGEGSTGQTELSRSRLATLPILVPPRRLIAAFDEITVPMREQCAAGERECQALVDVRDALLPKLISGELRIEDARDGADE